MWKQPRQLLDPIGGKGSVPMGRRGELIISIAGPLGTMRPSRLQTVWLQDDASQDRLRKKYAAEERKRKRLDSSASKCGVEAEDASHKTSEEDNCAEDVHVGASTVCVCGCFHRLRVPL